MPLQSEDRQDQCAKKLKRERPARKTAHGVFFFFYEEAAMQKLATSAAGCTSASASQYVGGITQVERTSLQAV